MAQVLEHRNSHFDNRRHTVECLDESDNGGSTIMRHEINRLMSFTNWPVVFMNPSQLAKAGFYYLNHDDAVRCAFCDIILGQWQEGDDPMEDHKKWSDKCPFVQGRECRNVAIELDSVPMLSQGQDVCGRFEFQIMPNSLPERETGQLNISKYGLPHREPVYSEYATYDQRLKTYTTWPAWPSTNKLKPEDLAAAGFFYQGLDDKTVCFYCRGGLNNWEDGDDAWEQHAKWFPKCGFVLLQKGSEFVEAVRNKLGPAVLSKEEALSLEFPKSSTCTTVEQKSEGILERKSETTSSNVEKTEEPSTSSAVKPKEIKTKELLPENNDNKSSDCVPLCKICYVKEVGVLFLPCRHTVSCVDCSFAVNSCPICREPLNASVRAFLS